MSDSHGDLEEEANEAASLLDELADEIVHLRKALLEIASYKDSANSEIRDIAGIAVEALDAI